MQGSCSHWVAAESERLKDCKREEMEDRQTKSGVQLVVMETAN